MGRDRRLKDDSRLFLDRNGPRLGAYLVALCDRLLENRALDMKSLPLVFTCFRCPNLLGFIQC
jgi:hypothetical protein